MSKLKTPIISIIIGEGGSGGALALAVANKVYMLENSVYSILSPEGFASILWKDATRAKEASEVMKITAKDLKCFIIDSIIEEPVGGAHEDPKFMCDKIKENILKILRCKKWLSKLLFTTNMFTRKMSRRLRKYIPKEYIPLSKTDLPATILKFALQLSICPKTDFRRRF